jgi:hypothetical protein
LHGVYRTAGDPQSPHPLNDYRVDTDNLVMKFSTGPDVSINEEGASNPN